ncbi:thermonuclease family protein [Candidatus Uhrbacteria bacterium]|nr:thermonuclease family protein [Candidatus Uhrbacteria bacterium]
MKFLNTRSGLVGFLLLLFLVGAETFFSARPGTSQPALPDAAPGQATGTVALNATILRVVDGDTFVAKVDQEDGEWTVRLLGINTPETVDPRRPVECFGKEASKKLHELLPDGTRIRLEADPQADERDKYDRLLRNVLLADGTDVNALMVRDGFAHAYLSFPLAASRKKELRDDETAAREEKLGLWAGVCAPDR